MRSFKSRFVFRLNTKIVGILLLCFVLFLVLAPLLTQVERRAEQLVQQGGTVYLRLFLWGAAFQFFISHPLTGIGLGQFVGTLENFPEMKNLPVFESTHGLSVHNILLTFLAETGLVGTAGFLFLLVAVVRLAWKGVGRTRTLEEFSWGWGFFMLFTVFAISFLFAGTWHYEFAYLMALLVLYIKRLEHSRRTNEY